VVIRTLCGKFYRLQATDNKGDICGRRESNGLRQFTLGRHYLTFFGIGYYVFSSVAGLIPITVPAPGDTIGNRQLDRTHTFILVATDNWRLSEQRQLSFSVSFGTMLSPCGRISVTDSFSRAKAETLWAARPPTFKASALGFLCLPGLTFAGMRLAILT